MAKISRPVIYAVVLGAAAYAVVLLTEPEPPARKSTTKPGTKTAVLAGGFTEEDMKARFPRYLSQPHDAFKPAVVPKKKEPAASIAVVSTTPNVLELWSLTGVSTVNNVVNALLETAAGDSVFLKVGDIWQGLHVVGIEPNYVKLVDQQGKVTKLGFAEPKAPKATTAPGGVAPVVLPAPAGVPLPAAPAADSVDPLQDRGSRRAARRANRQGGGN